MKNRFQDNLADIIFKLPEKPFHIWILLITIQAVQLIETGLYLISQLHPQNQLFYAMRRIIGLFTFRPIQEQFPFICILIQTLYLLYVILLINKFISGRSIMTYFLAYCQVWCPILITISIQSISKYTHIAAILLSLFTAFTSMLLWAARLMIINQDYISRNAKLSSIKSSIRMLVFCIQSILLYFEITDWLATIFISVSAGLILVAFILSITIIQNVDQQLQYLHFIKCISAFIFYCTLLIIHFVPNTDNLLLLVPALCILLQQLNVFKMIFEIKYNKLLQGLSKQQGQKDLVILLEIIGGIHKMKPDGVETLKGRSANFWTSKHIQFDFHLKARQICTELCIKNKKQQGEEINISSILKQQTYAVIEEYMTKKIRSKSKLLSFVMVSQCIKRELMIKALSIHSSIIGQMDFNQRILKKVLKLRLSHASNMKDKMGSIYQLSYGLCCLQNSIIASKIDQVMKLYIFFETFVTSLIELSNVTSKLMNKLSIKVIQSHQVTLILEEQSKIKDRLDKLISDHHIKINKEIIALFYIYYNHFCSQKLTVFQTLTPHLIALEKVSVKSTKELMICLVSATQHNRGSLMTANHTMIQFFGLDFEHIKQGVSHIEDFLPKPLSVIHNNLIARCLQTGISTIIGTTNRFYVVKGINTYPVQFQVKFQPYLDGINFSCEIRLINDESFILYDKSNEILGFSQMAQWCLPKKKLECKYLSDIFGSGRRTVQKNLYANDGQTSNIASSTKTFLQTNQYQINMKIYKTNDFQLGICKFSKNQLGQSTKNITSEQSQKFLNQVESSHQSEIQHVQQNYQLMILQNKISTMSQDSSIVTAFRGIIIAYGSFLIVATFFFYVTIISKIQELKAVSMYQNTLFQNSPQSILLSVDRIYNMYYAVYHGYYPSNISFGNNQTVVQFLNQQFRQQIDNFNQLKSNLYSNLDLLPSNLIQTITSQSLQIAQTSGDVISLPLYSFLSYILDRKQRVRFYTELQWVSKGISKNHNFLINQTLVQLQTKIFGSIFKNIQKNRKQLQFLLMVLLVCIQSVATFGIIVVSVILHKIIKQKNKYIRLLTQLDNKILSLKLNINQRISILLKNIIKTSLDNLVISQTNEIIQFKYGPSKSTFTKEIINIEENSNKEIQNGEKFKSNLRKQINNSSFQCKQYSILAVSIVIFLPIFAMLLFGFFGVALNTINAFEYYKEFVRINSQVSKCTAGLLNVNAMMIAHQNKQIYGMWPSQFFSQNYQCLINRQIENKLKDFVPSVSHQKPVQTIIQNYLYLSKCDQNDQYCSKILRGSITRGFTSGLLSYLSISVELYNEILKFTTQLTDYQIYIIKQVFQSFSYYIRGMVEMTGFVLGLVKDIFQYNKKLIIILLQMSVFTEAVLVLLFIGFIFKSKRQIYQLKKEIFTILPVDILVDNINFNFEIRNIS